MFSSMNVNDAVLSENIRTLNQMTRSVLPTLL